MLQTSPLQTSPLQTSPLQTSPPQTSPPPKRLLFTIPHAFTENTIRLRIIAALIGRGGK